MILIHRVTPFFIGLATVSGFVAMLSFRLHPVAVMVATVAAVALLYARLVGFAPRMFQFWMLVGTPLLFLVSSFGLLLFLERASAQIALAVVVSAFIFFFAEHVFSFVHVPANYETYAIEHLSLVMNVASVFFVSVTAFGMRVFLDAFAPLWLLSLLFFGVILFGVFGTLWASKADVSRARLYALAGSFVVTELFAATTFLPTGYYTSAALIALFAYLFLGLTRAHFIERLSPKVVRRYAATSAVILLAVLGTSEWT